MVSILLGICLVLDFNLDPRTVYFVSELAWQGRVHGMFLDEDLAFTGSSDENLVTH